MGCSWKPEWFKCQPASQPPTLPTPQQEPRALQFQLQFSGGNIRTHAGPPGLLFAGRGLAASVSFSPFCLPRFDASAFQRETRRGRRWERKQWGNLLLGSSVCLFLLWERNAVKTLRGSERDPERVFFCCCCCCWFFCLLAENEAFVNVSLLEEKKQKPIQKTHSMA